MVTRSDPLLGQIFPTTAEVNTAGHLVIGGCDVAELAREFGTPLYLFDEATLRGQCRAFQTEFRSRYPDTTVAYASKAYLGRALAQIMKDEGMALDVVSGGELAIALSVGFPAARVYFHGNNKGADELACALDVGVGRVVVDNVPELRLLERLAGERAVRAGILIRVSPGVDPHTHHLTTTGITDSKFGVPIVTGQAEAAVAEAIAARHLALVGVHAHLGSPIFEVEPYQEAIGVVLAFARTMRDRYGLDLREFSPGGGFAVQYVVDTPAPAVAAYAEAIVGALVEQLDRHGLARPRLVLEPGRAIVGRAGVAVYTVGAIKEIPGVRTYASVDGGMADNIRPAIYGARYEALVANRVHDEPDEVVTIAGKYCESGDILIRDARLPRLAAGDLIAIPTSGAYCLAMASSYNAALKPPIVLVADGRARLIRRRETYDDLMRCDVPLA